MEKYSVNSVSKNITQSIKYFVVPSASRVFILWLSLELLLPLQHLVYDMISHHAQYAGHPPATWHDDSAGRPATLIIIGPRLIAAQGLTDLLAMGVAPPALYAADSLVVQSRVECHAFPFLLL